MAVSAVKVASKHSEAIGQRARIGMEEWLLLDGVTLHSADISPGDVEGPTEVVADFANAGLAVWDGATMSASEAAHAIAVELLVKLAFTDMFVDDVAQGGHGGRPYGNYRPERDGRARLSVGP